MTYFDNHLLLSLFFEFQIQFKFQISKMDLKIQGPIDNFQNDYY